MSDAYLGEIRLFSFSKFPVDWLPCDGRLLPIAQYQALFTILGTTYGGDGVQTFGLPNLSQRVPIHFGTGTGLSPRPFGSSGGTGVVTLNSDQMPSHNHLFQTVQAAGLSPTPGPSVYLGAITGEDVYYSTDKAKVAVMSDKVVTNVGSGAAHNNVMPTLVANFCICVNGLFPSKPSSLPS